MAKNKDVVSILIPAYNVEEYMDVCLESIVNQTYKQLEIIVADDGSTDNTSKKCDIWKDRDNRIKVYHKSNEGLAQTRNFLLQHATGDYICFVDSDDYIDLEYVEKLLFLLQNSGADMAGCRFKRVTEDNVISPNIDKNYNFTSDSTQFIKYLYNDLGVFIPAWCKLTRKEIFQGICFPMGKLHEDGYVTRKLALNCKKIVWVQDPMYYYRYNNQGITGSFSVKRMEDDLGWINADIEFFEQKNRKDLKVLAEKVYCFSLLNYWKELPSFCKKQYAKSYTRRALHVAFGKDTLMKARVKYFGMIAYIYTHLNEGK